MQSFHDLVGLLAGTTEVPYVGTIERLREDSTIAQWRVWRHGRCARVENPVGSLALIAGQRTYWRPGLSPQSMVALPRAAAGVDFELAALDMLEPYEYWWDWLSTDRDLVEGSLRPSVYLGRPAWMFTAPEAKGSIVQVTVDSELGLPMLLEADGGHVLERWTEIEELDPDPDLFSYNGEWIHEKGWSYPTDWAPE